jgi:hippurate hydrolase
MKPLCLSLLLTSSLFAADVASVTKLELPSLVSLYQDLHGNPELSLHEVETAARTAKELRPANSKVKVGSCGRNLDCDQRIESPNRRNRLSNSGN